MAAPVLGSVGGAGVTESGCAGGRGEAGLVRANGGRRRAGTRGAHARGPPNGSAGGVAGAGPGVGCLLLYPICTTTVFLLLLLVGNKRGNGIFVQILISFLVPTWDCLQTVFDYFSSVLAWPLFIIILT